MDATVFRDAEVQRRMSDFVLLPIDVDKNMVGRTHRISVLPSYVVYDPAERERFRISGACVWPGSEIGRAPGQERSSWLTLGNAYRLAKDPRTALDAYQHAQSLAAPGSTAHQQATEALARPH